jgi:hypothetical protein
MDCIEINERLVRRGNHRVETRKHTRRLKRTLMVDADLRISRRLGLSRCTGGDGISDLVRLLTISDIFAALIESRPYRPAMSSQDGYRVLCEMDGRLERPLVKAFCKVALVAWLLPGANVVKL